MLLAQVTCQLVRQCSRWTNGKTATLGLTLRQENWGLVCRKAKTLLLSETGPGINLTKLSPSALEQLKDACIFTKLDLRSAYNLIRIWAGDVQYNIGPLFPSLVTSLIRWEYAWTQRKLQTIKDLQRFLGFSKFHHQFIRNYSTIAAPLKSLTKGGGKKLDSGSEAESAFQQLKTAFTTASILIDPNPV